MAKYSTGGGSSGEAGSCELCGAEGRPLQEERIAGATLQICPECRSRHGDGGGSSGGRRDDASRGEESRRKQAARNLARMDDARKGDARRWEQGTDYEEDPLPYLVRGYGETVAEARQEAGLTSADLAGELGVREADIIAVEQGRANSAGLGGSLIEAIEERLNVRLAQE